MKSISLIKAPLVSEQYFSGVSLMADALFAADLPAALGATLTKELPMPAWQPGRDAATHILNPHEVVDYSIAIADSVEHDLSAGHFPVVVGGDCTILIGALLGMKRSGPGGLFFIDGHADYYAPGISPSGETADMELGFVVGRGPDILSNIQGQKPLVEASKTVVFGFRDEDLVQEAGGESVRNGKMHCVSLRDTQYYGFNNKVEESLALITKRSDKFWVHIDFDVLDDAIMPAVDYRMPGGLNNGEFVSLLQRIKKTQKAVGVSLAIFNPTLDWDKSLAKHLVALLRAGLVD